MLGAAAYASSPPLLRAPLGDSAAVQNFLTAVRGSDGRGAAALKALVCRDGHLDRARGGPLASLSELPRRPAGAPQWWSALSQAELAKLRRTAVYQAGKEKSER